MFVFFFLLVGSFTMMYSYYNFLLVLLNLELLMLLIFSLMMVSEIMGAFSFTFIILFSCFMVMEVILGLSLLLINFRGFGMKNFFLW